MTGSKSQIGTKNESSLHKALKFQYALPGNTEKPLGGYVCDAISPKGEIIEIQTGNFGGLKEKLLSLVKQNKVRLIYPVIVTKMIELYDCDGKLLSRRKSPKTGKTWDIFNELIYAPELVKLKGLTIELAMVNVTEKRRDDGKGSWRRKGRSIEDRRLDCFKETIVFKKKSDWRRFLPLTGNFTSKDLAEAIHSKPDIAQKTLYVLEKAGMVKKLKRQGRFWLYQGVKP